MRPSIDSHMLSRSDHGRRIRSPSVSLTPPSIRVWLRGNFAEYEGSDLIFVPSELNYRTFIENGVPAAKLRKVPYGVDLRMFTPQPKRDDVFRVLFIGQIGLRKGVPYLLEALAPLNLPKFELCLAGAIHPEIRSILAPYEGRFRYLRRHPAFKATRSV